MTRAEAAYRYIRDIALVTPGISWSVRRSRAAAIERSYSLTVARYAEMLAPPESTEAMLMRRSGERLLRFRTINRRPRILFVGTDHRQDSSGLLQALARIGEVTPFRQPDGTYGQATPDGHLSFDNAIPNGRRILELAATAASVGLSYDVLIGQMWDGYIDGDALSQLRQQFPTLVVNIGLDDRHAFAVRKLGRLIGTRGLIPHIDLAATASPESVGWYLKEGCPAVFFPEASDPNLFRPQPDVAKCFDVAFVGACYGIRQRIVERLLAAGIRVEARGAGWPAGRIPTNDVPRLFAQARIVLGVATIGHSESLYGLKLRDFDGPMSGTCYVTHDNPDLARLFDVGEEIAVYRDDDDCVRVVRDLLRDDARREGIAQRGRDRAVREHTWIHRFGDLFQVLHGSMAGS